MGLPGRTDSSLSVREMMFYHLSNAENAVLSVICYICNNTLFGPPPNKSIRMRKQARPKGEGLSERLSEGTMDGWEGDRQGEERIGTRYVVVKNPNFTFVKDEPSHKARGIYTYIMR